eukprot:6826148-Prymnesium_polylepis.1
MSACDASISRLRDRGPRVHKANQGGHVRVRYRGPMGATPATPTRCRKKRGWGPSAHVHATVAGGRRDASLNLAIWCYG